MHAMLCSSNLSLFPWRATAEPPSPHRLLPNSLFQTHITLAHGAAHGHVQHSVNLIPERERERKKNSNTSWEKPRERSSSFRSRVRRKIWRVEKFGDDAAAATATAAEKKLYSPCRVRNETNRIESDNSKKLLYAWKKYVSIFHSLEKHIEVTKGGLVEKRVWNQNNMWTGSLILLEERDCSTCAF